MFRAARRHSRMVRFYRGAIPVSLIGIMATIAAISYLQPLKPFSKLPIDAAATVLMGNQINMQAPQLGGITRDGRPYNLTARAAAQDRTNKDMLELTDVTASIEMVDKSTVTVTAATGRYDIKADTMVLKTDVVVTSSNGYSVHMNEAQVEVKANRIVSDQSVEVTLSNGTIKSRRMEVSENGDLMRFTGDVDVYLVPQEGSPASTNGASSAASSAPPAAAKTRQ
jgi:lipopolysaccharide export system protein LptC